MLLRDALLPSTLSGFDAARCEVNEVIGTDVT